MNTFCKDGLCVCNLMSVELGVGNWRGAQLELFR